MKNIVVFWVEEVIIGVMWTILYGKMFPKSRFYKQSIGALHIVLIIFLALLCKEKMSLPIVYLMSVITSAIWNGVCSKRNSAVVVAESLISYVIIRSLWIVATLLGFGIVKIINCMGNLMIEGACNSIIQIILFYIAVAKIDVEKWESIVEKYSLVIILAASVLFVISYGIISTPYAYSKRTFNHFAVLVIITLLIILTAWIISVFQRKKEKEAYSARIEELVREAHKVKETIPAVKRELLVLKRQIDIETKWETAKEIDEAISEVAALQKDIEKMSREQLLKAPNMSVTGILFLDRQLEGEREEAAAAGITFECIVRTPVTQLMEKGLLNQQQIQQLIGDLYRNAFRAVKERGEKGGRMLLIMGATEKGYRIQMSDNGVPFPKEVLDRLGERGVSTTGSGHGLADTLELLSACGGSLKVEESTTDRYTKSVVVIFDTHNT